MDMISNFNLNPVYKKVNKEMKMRALPEDIKRMYYVRYVGDFIIGIQGSHSDALTRVNHLKIQTNLKLNLQKTHVRHFASESIHFLVKLVLYRNHIKHQILTDVCQ